MTEETLQTILSRVDENLDASLERLFGLMRIPSVSTDPAYAPKVQDAAQWLVDELRALGFEAQARPTGGHPIVMARRLPKDGGPDAPHVLFYGHYDVQPADPEALWDTPAFEPVFMDGPHGRRIVGRGSSDDKGQLMTFIEACRAWIETTGDLPVPVTLLLEGEEETGSPNLEPFLEQTREELAAADIALVCDTAMWDIDTPAVTTSLRGLMIDEVIISGPSRDLHSGFYGGVARNPIHVLARIIGDLQDEDGRIQVPGFYDDVPEISADQKAQWDALGRDAEGFLGAIGLSESTGERDRSVLEQTWSRPTCDVNGIIGGYTGEGSKTLIPAQASAKVSFRLAGDQDPVKIRAAFRKFVEDRLPSDCKVAYKAHGGSPALTLNRDNPHLAKAMAALDEEYGRAALAIGCGGSIPIVGSFKRALGLDSLMVGFALEDDRIHSPNEKYEVKSFHKGTRSWARILGALGA